MSILKLIVENFFSFIVILSVIVFIHEYGHYIVAKLCGVKIEAFSIGFGKEIFGWNDKSGTRWKIAILPFGGYVQMFGDGDPSSSSIDAKKLEKLSEEEKKQTFYYKNVYQRLAVVSAGPLFNLLTAIFILTFSYNITGMTIFTPVADEIITDSPAEKAGIIKNDRIVSINGTKIDSLQEMKNIVSMNPSKELTFKVLRDFKEIDLKLTPEIKTSKDVFGNEIKVGIVGVVSKSFEYKKLNIFSSFIEANKSVYTMSANTLKALGQMITGSRSTDELGGPLQIAKYSGQSFRAGAAAVFWFIALISANLGLMNLLPIPALDGGHILFYLIEIIRRKPIPEKIQEYSLRTGFILLISLMIFVTFSDITKLFK